MTAPPVALCSNRGSRGDATTGMSVTGIRLSGAAAMGTLSWVPLGDSVIKITLPTLLVLALRVWPPFRGR